MPFSAKARPHVPVADDGGIDDAVARQDEGRFGRRRPERSGAVAHPDHFGGDATGAVEAAKAAAAAVKSSVEGMKSSFDADSVERLFRNNGEALVKALEHQRRNGGLL